jgi:hypothetical protein
MPAIVKLTLNQLAEVLGNLSPDEAQTLLEIIDMRNLEARWEIAKQEYAEGKLISEEELFQDLD